MTHERRLAEIRKFCRAHGDPAVVAKYAKYFTEGYDAYGVPSAKMEAQRDAWLAKWDDLGRDGFLDLGDRLVATGKYEEGSFALWFAQAFRKQHTAATFERLGRWLDEGGYRNWGHVDAFCALVLSPLLVDGVAKPRAMAAWRASPSKWKRRAVPVALIPLVKRGTPVRGLLTLVSPLMKDDEKPVQQGLGWFLREAWKADPEPVEALLLKWKERCGRVIVQYATEKMTAAQKARFRRSGPPAARKKATARGAKP